MADSLVGTERLLATPACAAVADDDEAALVRAAQERPEAFAALYERHVDAIYRYLQVRAGTDDAADLTQQVFLKAFAGLPKYKARGLPFSAWLFRIARNLAADRHRSRFRTPEELLPGVAQPGSAANPEETALRTEMYERLRSLLAELDLEKRELLALRFAAGLSSRQIAGVTGRSEAAVKKQLTRILRTLKEKYG
ncbi:MAG TPA: sigma-70 family RNA polymerase sigma factor [Candidatus Acidoferrum sp.]|jgi:RNA polymerase sigma-70 factor (ECF subfamily)|nr:sigma-70 family RNA polymerase sigma factor [Candidatus Acidoferrum sp.]